MLDGLVCEICGRWCSGYVRYFSFHDGVVANKNYIGEELTESCAETRARWSSHALAIVTDDALIVIGF